ncbi:unnamed protein product, partial [Candidula unifasciata]
QTPVAQNVCGSLRRDGHWKCLGLTFMIVVCLATIAWCQFDKTEKTVLTYLDMAFSNSDRSGSCKEGYIYIPVACVIILYLVYLVECWHSHAWLQLKYKCDIASVYTTISRMQEALPVIWWKATCYHYVRRSRQVMRYRNGDAFTSTQIYYERVDSNTAGAAFNFTRCGVKDISRPLSDLEKYPAVKIKISKGFSFANLDTEYEFEEQRSQFFQEHETKDDYMEGREGMDLINDPNNLPWYVSRAVFWIGSLVLLSWPLRAIIEFKTAHLHYHIHKLFGSNYLGSDRCPGLISRVSTMNSTEFEMSIRNNNVIVPSYSEAMLVDIHEQQGRDYGAIKTYPVKFPRSLTNATLASRSTWRSATPTVMMNQVKKFKSCNVLENVESTDPSLQSGSFRYHVRQLMRERGKKQAKTAISLSHGNISGFLSNENVRRNRYSIDTSNGVTSSVCNYHSIEPSNMTSAFSNGASSKTTSGSVEARCYDPDVQTVTSLGPKLINKHPKSPLSRSKSVPDSDSSQRYILSHIPYLHRDKPPLESISNSSDIHQVLNSNPTSSNYEGYNKNIFSRTTTAPIFPTTPPSPPAYEEAIKMRQIFPAFLPKSALNSVDQAAEIGFTENSSSELPMSNMAVTRARRGHGDKGNTDLVRLEGPIDSEIDIGKSEQSSERQVDDSREVVYHLHTSTNSEEEKRYSNSHFTRHRNDQQQSNKLKALPKVSKITHTGADDSDTECLHGTYSDLGNFDTVPSSDDCLSNRASQQRTFGIGSISRLAVSVIAQDGMCDPTGSLNQSLNSGTQSPSVSKSAITQARTSGLDSFCRHRMETSV